MLGSTPARRVYYYPLVEFHLRQMSDPEHPDKKQPLSERIKHLGDQVTSLKKAIREELDWREKLRPFDFDEWDDDEDRS